VARDPEAGQRVEGLVHHWDKVAEERKLVPLGPSCAFLM
jgi:hypothetical protein